MRRMLLTAMMIALAMYSYSQNWGEIKSKKNEYFSVESTADTKIQAVNKGDEKLAKTVAEAYAIKFRLTEEETRALSTSGPSEIDQYIKKKIDSYQLQQHFHTLEIQDEPTIIIGRYISRQKIEEVFAKRKTDIDRYINEAKTAERERNISVALRYYYWSYMLLKTMQNPDTVTFADKSTASQYRLMEWLPGQISRVCEGIRSDVIERDGQSVTLRFTYNGKEISALDFRYNVGTSWSAMYSAKDGIGEIELPSGYSGENLRLKYEYRYEEYSKNLDAQVYNAFTFIAGNTAISQSTSTTKMAVSAAASAEAALQPTAKEMSHLKELTESDKQKYKITIETVVAAIRAKQTYGLEKYFTTEGYDVFRKLIEYGSAKVKSYSELSYTRMGDEIVVRSIPMLFTFRNSSSGSFLEDVVFTVNASGKISNISFGLGKESTSAIMARDQWGDTVQQQVINFLEVYKTAYALKRLDYLDTLFADHAVIIVGRVVMKTSKYPDADRYGAHKIVKKTRYTKEKYMEHLKKCFESNEFINIKFAKTTLQKQFLKPIFGIQLKQYYNSSTYGDEGYLYLQVDMTNPSEPVIIVRTWQEDFDPDMGRPYGMQDF